MTSTARLRSLALPVLALSVVGLAACSSGSSGGSSASPTAATTSAAPASSSAAPASSSAAPTEAPCTTEALQAALPAGSEIVSFVCAKVTDQQWAGGKATAPGGEVVFFAKADAPSTTWTAVEPGQICGTASAGLPPKILALCPS